MEIIQEAKRLTTSKLNSSLLEYLSGKDNQYFLDVLPYCFKEKDKVNNQKGLVLSIIIYFFHLKQKDIIHTKKWARSNINYMRDNNFDIYERIGAILFTLISNQVNIEDIQLTLTDLRNLIPFSRCEANKLVCIWNDIANQPSKSDQKIYIKHVRSFRSLHYVKPVNDLLEQNSLTTNDFAAVDNFEQNNFISNSPVEKNCFVQINDDNKSIFFLQKYGSLILIIITLIIGISSYYIID